MEFNFIKITQQSAGGILKGGYPLESYFSLLNFLFVEKKESLGPGCMAEQEAELPTRPSGLSACGPSDL